MITPIRLIAFFSLLCTSYFLYATGSTTATDTTVYFIPFQVETYVPITPENITDQAWEKWNISTKRHSQRLLAIINHGHSAAFDRNRVRALVVSDGKKYFIDTNGVMVPQSRDSGGVTIDKAAFIKFRDSLRADQRQVLKREK